MAVPLKQPETKEQRSAASALAQWTSKYGAALGGPVLAVLFAFIAGAIVILITWPDKTVDPFTNIYNAYTTLFHGAFGSLTNFSTTLVVVTPLILASLSVAIAFRAGLFNIGAAGQLAVGGMTADIIGLTFPSWPSWLLVPTMLLGSILAGAVWGGIVGILKAWRGSHEVITTIMLNWIAFYVTDYLINSPRYTAPFGVAETVALPANGTLPPVVNYINQFFGTQLNPFLYKVDAGIFFALIAVVIYWFITSRTTFGYEIRVIGQNPKAALYAGIPIKRNTFLVMAIAGAFSGLAGAVSLMGQQISLAATAYSQSNTGFDAIAVALLGRTTAIGVVISSLFFGGLRSGTSEMQAIAHIDSNIVLILEALVLFFIAAEFLPVLRRVMPRWVQWSRRPTLVPTASVPPGIDLAENGNGNAQNGVEISDLGKEE
jgi:ABC-type uncharacterized transport system permease subunit